MQGKFTRCARSSCLFFIETAVSRNPEEKLRNKAQATEQASVE